MTRVRRTYAFGKTDYPFQDISHMTTKGEEDTYHVLQQRMDCMGHEQVLQ